MVVAADVSDMSTAVAIHELGDHPRTPVEVKLVSGADADTATAESTVARRRTMVASTPFAQNRCAELHSDILNCQLPSTYAPQLEGEADQWLTMALDGLRTAVAIGDLQRGANFHISALNQFVRLKYPLSDALRSEIIVLLYHLVTADVDVQFGSRQRWCGLLCKLLRRGKDLELSLPWRPIFDMLFKHSTSKLRTAEFASRSHAQAHVAALTRCASQARRHFPDGSSAGILEAIEPMLCPKDPQVASAARLARHSSPCCIPSHGRPRPLQHVEPPALRLSPRLTDPPSWLADYLAPPAS